MVRLKSGCCGRCDALHKVSQAPIIVAAYRSFRNLAACRLSQSEWRPGSSSNRGKCGADAAVGEFGSAFNDVLFPPTTCLPRWYQSQTRPLCQQHPLLLTRRSLVTHQPAAGSWQLSTTPLSTRFQQPISHYTTTMSIENLTLEDTAASGVTVDLYSKPERKARKVIITLQLSAKKAAPTLTPHRLSRVSASRRSPESSASPSAAPRVSFLSLPRPRSTSRPDPTATLSSARPRSRTPPRLPRSRPSSSSLPRPRLPRPPTPRAASRTASPSRSRT